MIFRVLLGQGFTAEPPGKRVAFYRRMAAIALFSMALFPGVFPAILAMPGLAVAQPAAVSDTLGARMLELVNAERAKVQQPPVAFEARLTTAACRHAKDLARGGPLSHRGSDGSDLTERLTGSGYPFAMAAENLAAGIATPDETVWLWSGSPGHRRNMLTADFRDAGIAHLPGAGGEVWVLVLARQRAASNIPSAAQKPRNTPQNRQQTAAPPGDLRDDKLLTCY
jgi:uncharacterized protein YkwD